MNARLTQTGLTLGRKDAHGLEQVGPRPRIVWMNGGDEESVRVEDRPGVGERNPPGELGGERVAGKRLGESAEEAFQQLLIGQVNGPELPAQEGEQVSHDRPRGA